MAWRIEESVERGEIDNRTRDRVTGKLWLCGRDEPVHIELTGNPWRDLAGQYLRFTNPDPKPLPEKYQNFATDQTGVVGDMTAARKVKILEFPIEELHKYYKTGVPMPYHWGNCLYLEWYSVRNGRVVIEGPEWQLQVEPEAAWQMTKAEEIAQAEANGRALTGFMDMMVEAAEQAEQEDLDDDAPQSTAEAEADAEAARMDLLNDRIDARLQREDELNADTLDRIMEEERERLRKERGEPEPEPPTPEEAAEQNRRIEEMNAAAEEALQDGSVDDQNREHPLVTHCHDVSRRLRKAIKANAWLPENAHQEHPLHVMQQGLWFASAKLAGALNGDLNDWPPDPLFAGDTLVRLKKARSYLADSMAGAQAAEAEKLCDPVWLKSHQQELESVQYEVHELIDEVRGVLRRSEGE